ncbi:hypothetical protein F5Y01DRAFT_320442 [Xylaria sp. FL0043]|nr:hypothetical protein F5Y01DRAFT_320442 [Xylaria sp. FL0043]
MSGSDIAIVGLACRFPGEARSPEAFYEMLLQGRNAWSEVPSTRFNSRAFLHPNRERPGSLVAGGGYFLQEDVSKWDAPFFATSAAEARAIDPQQRLLLEVAYESLENAGIPIEAVSNTETACFVGGFTHDYKTIVTRDIQAAPQYAITGTAMNMLANRVSWFFNLRGASVTTDTACSSSLAALHLACETIRSGSNKTRCALVGGTSLILGPDVSCGLNALGFLSPDSRCYAFDSRANGYARGEAICMLVVKHIEDAIRDGDPIRAVIRGTGMNQDGKTAGIVLPDGDAQMSLIRQTYEFAGLDPADTQYAELHGTGTKAGDPTEMTAIARTIAYDRRSTLYCGSVKTQIGHTEGAAGIAGVIKCVLAMERGIIPPHLNFNKANPRLRLNSWNIVLPSAPIPWPESEIRRCSINNFGFGGTNAHAILDDAYNYLRLRDTTLPSPLQEPFPSQNDTNTHIAKSEIPAMNGHAPNTNGHSSGTNGHTTTNGHAPTTNGGLPTTNGKALITNGETPTPVGEVVATNGKLRTSNGELSTTNGEPPSIDGDVLIENREVLDAPARVFVLSAPEQDAIARQRQAYASYLKTRTSFTVQNLAYTLSERRSLFQWRHAVIASSVDDLLSSWEDENLKPTKAIAPCHVSFVFTGQGAQWFAMGRELVAYEVFAASVKKSAAVLSKLGSLWDAWDELFASESESKVNQAEYAQPLCTVLQIALVDLLRHWGVKPHAVIGHSSGEIGAAYASCALSREDCLKVAYHRGRVSSKAREKHPHGTMMAVGLPVEDAKSYVAQVGETVIVACINSPTSVTLSGDRAALLHLQTTFNEKNIFCRLLQVENAYHSPQMLSVADEYRDSIADIVPIDQSSVQFYSTVDGCRISTSRLTADYWVANLCSPVQFVAALDDMMYANVERKVLKSKSQATGILLEVGPHSALAGPVKQFKSARSGLEHVDYRSVLARGQDAASTTLRVMGWLWMKGALVDLNKVNSRDETPAHRVVLVDLPSYSWNHSTSYWHEAQASRNHRFPEYPRHDLIGSRLENYNPLEPIWKNQLRVSELPWLRDHQIHGDIIFPAAGVICAAIEAARQFADGDNLNQDIIGFELRDFCIIRPVVIQDLDSGVETFLHLKKRKLGMSSGAGMWHEFTFYSCQSNGAYAEHACGLIEIQYSKPLSEVDNGKESTEEVLARQEKWNLQKETCVDVIDSIAHYDFWKSEGLEFGRTFQGLTSIRQKNGTVVFEVTVPDTRSSMPFNWESDVLIHPATLDACLQTMLVAIPTMPGVPKQIWIPTTIRSLQISSHVPREHGQVLHGCCESSRRGIREMIGSIVIGNKTFDTHPAIVMDGVTFTGLGVNQTLPRDSRLQEQSLIKLCSTPCWKPDVDLLEPEVARARLDDSGISPDELTGFCSQANEVVKIMCRRVLKNLDPSTRSSLPPYLRKYVKWMSKRCESLGISDVPPSSRRSDEDDNCVMAKFLAAYPFDGQFCCHVFGCLDNVFTQKTTPLTVLMSEDNLSRFYRETYGAFASTRVLQNWFDIKGHKNPRLRVIEIGGGTASAAAPVLEKLGGRKGESPRFLQWTFTDISTGWFQNARELLQAYEPRVEYKRLDIESDVVEQGFDPESYDVVLAVNVLHATKNLKKTLENCRRLLKPGGNLVLGENTNPNDISSFIFGILPGWWVAEDGREDGPLLSQAEWDVVLMEAGFSTPDIRLPDTDDVSSHRMSVLVSSRHEEQDFRSKDIMIVTPNDCNTATTTLASLIRCEFERLGLSAETGDLQTAAENAHGKTVVSLLEYENPFLEEVGPTQFEQAKQIFLHSTEILWVTRSDPDDKTGHPSRRIISGLLRCLKTEDSSRRLSELHFCRAATSDIDSAARTVCRRLCSFWKGKQNLPDEMETVEMDGALCIPRYVPEPVLNRSLSLKESSATPEIEDLVQPKRPLKLTIGVPGMLDTLHFVDDDTPFQPLPDDEVEIEVKACAMNFLDIMIAMGQIQHPDLGYEATGVIRHVGAKVTEFRPGDRVIYMGLGAMRTYIRSPECCVHALPASMTLEEGVTIPIAYATAYQSLIEVARLQKGESVLIHAAAGGLGQALIQIAKLLQAEIFCTVGSNAKKQAVIDLGVKPDHIFSSRDLSFSKGIHRLTHGRGVDVVVNSLAGEALRKSWECLAPYGRFIEVGKRDILGNSGLDMRPFLENTLFAGVNLERMMVVNPQRSSKLVSQVLELFEQGEIGHIRPIAVHDFTEVESVFRAMQRGAHIGKLVLRITPESRVLVTPRKSIPLRLDPNSTYVLVGGLGGLGRAQALFMAEHGARHIAFISRSGSGRQEAKDLLEKLKYLGVDARAYAGDIANRLRLREILEEMATTMPPIRGVIQGAMVLDDGLFHKMTFEQWVTATRPKIQGSWNLHELLPENLDFFIQLSSLAGIIGSISQANYSAGNTFQDALAQYRHAKGLPATSIDLGLMKDIGYAEEHKDVAANKSSLKLTSVGKDQFLRILKCAMAGTADGKTPFPTQVIVGAGTGGAVQAAEASSIGGGDYYWLRTLPQFAYLQRLDVQETSVNEERHSSDGAIERLSHATSMDAAAEIVQDILLAKVTKVIMVPVTDIDTSKPVYTYGVDSLVAVELRNWLAMELKSDISIFDLTSSAPITEVCKKIASRSHLVPTEAKEETGGA